MDVRNPILLVSSQNTTIPGGWGIGELDNKANSVQLQLQLQLPTGTELGKIWFGLVQHYPNEGWSASLSF